MKQKRAKTSREGDKPSSEMHRQADKCTEKQRSAQTSRKSYRQAEKDTGKQRTAQTFR